MTYGCSSEPRSKATSTSSSTSGISSPPPLTPPNCATRHQSLSYVSESHGNVSFTRFSFSGSLALLTCATTTPGMVGASSEPPEASPYSERNCRAETCSQVVNGRPDSKTWRTPVAVYFPSKGNPAPLSATGWPGRISGLPVIATSSSAKEFATSSASAFAACLTCPDVVYGVCVSVSSAVPNGDDTFPGVMSARMSSLFVAGESAYSERLLRMSQPRAAARLTCPAAVIATRAWVVLWPNSRTSGDCAAGVVSDGAPAADGRSVNWSLPCWSK